MLKRKYLLLTVLLSILSFNIFAQDTKPIVPLDTGIAKKVVKDLERYDLCVIQRESLLNETSILKNRISKTDSVLKLQKSVNHNLSNIIHKKDTIITNKNRQIRKIKKERNVAAGGIVIGIILTVLITG